MVWYLNNFKGNRLIQIYKKTHNKRQNYGFVLPNDSLSNVPLPTYVFKIDDATP